MAGVNKVILVGHLGRDPEIRYTGSGKAVGSFTLATSRSWSDKQGQRQEKTEWHRIVVWERLAELCGQHLFKGRQVYIEGELQTREWTDKENNKRTTTEVRALDVQFLGGKDAARRGQEENGHSAAPDRDGTGSGAPSGPGGPSRGGGRSGGDGDYGPPPGEDDVPF